MNKWLFAAIIILCGVAAVAMKQAKEAEENWKNAMANLKAYSNQLSDANDKNMVLTLTVNQLEYYQDSIIRELDEVRKELKIKDKKLKSLQYVSSTFTRIDTLVLKDTVFKDPGFSLDTLIGDEWYKVGIGLKYPSTVSVKPEFKSKKILVLSIKKETVNPPKKFFVARWFQKKHKVLNLDVIERNPYVENETSRFVEIIK